MVRDRVLQLSVRRKDDGLWQVIEVSHMESDARTSIVVSIISHVLAKALLTRRFILFAIAQVDLHQSPSPVVKLETPLSVRDALVFLDFAVFTSNLSGMAFLVKSLFLPVHRGS